MSAEPNPNAFAPGLSEERVSFAPPESIGTTVAHTDEGTAYKRMVSAVLERDRRIATMGAEMGLLRGKLKDTVKRCESSERLVTVHQQDASQLRTEVDALKAKAHGLQAVLERTTADLDRREKELNVEREKRKQLESDVEDLRGQLKNHDKAARVQLSKFQEGPKKSFHEVDLLHKQLADQENVITVLRQENFRLLQILKNHGIASATTTEPPEYSKLVTQQRMKDVPSLKKFKCTPTRNRTPSPNAVPSSRSPSAGDAFGLKNTPIPATTNTAAARSRSKSPIGNASPITRNTVFRPGHRIVWNGFAGIVRYVGELHCAEGQWVGVELSTKNGDHSGSIDGVQYFGCPPKTGIFCRMWDLVDGRTVPGGKEDKVVSNSNGVDNVFQSQPPPQTVSQLREQQKLYTSL
eukprot:PhF_6_TR25314/c0_g1_i1/m.34950